MTTEEIIKSVTDICKASGVEHLSLFGSYANGTQIKYSDMDFVVRGVPDIDDLREQMDALPTLVKIDLFEYDSIENPFLKEDMDLCKKNLLTDTGVFAAVWIICRMPDQKMQEISLY